MPNQPEITEGARSCSALDGWGQLLNTADNTVQLARTPVFDRLWETCPRGPATSGGDVGLPDGQMGIRGRAYEPGRAVS